MNVVKQPLLFLAIVGFFLLIVQWIKIDDSDLAIDYNIYYKAAEQFKSDPSSLYDDHNTGFDQYLYPPPAIVLFVVCTFIPYKLSYWIFTVFMYAALVASVLVWRKVSNGKFGTDDDKNNYLFIAFALTSAPVFHNVVLGQINCLVLLLCMLYLYFAERKPVIAGIFLAAACWIKVYPVVLALWGVFSKERRKSIYSLVISSVSVVLLMAFVIPFHLYIDFVNKLLLVSQYSCAHLINQSVTAFFLRAHIPFEQIFQWPNVYEVPGWIRMLNYGLLAITLVGTGIQLYKNPNNIATAAVLLAFIPVFSPLGWGHSFVFMLPLVMLWIQTVQERFGQTWLSFFLVMGIGFLLLIPVHNEPNFLKKFPLLLQNLFYSRLSLISVLCIVTIFITINSRQTKGKSAVVQSA